MDPAQGLQRSHLFTLRLWREPHGDGQVEWRGQVHYILSGERRSFRDWSTLASYLEAKLQELEERETPEDGAG